VSLPDNANRDEGKQIFRLPLEALMTCRGLIACRAAPCGLAEGFLPDFP
jgi:hypothetical protein